jgi:hypothetical protein
LDGRRIDFRLVQDADGLIGRAMDEKGVVRNPKSRPEMGEQRDEKSNSRRVFPQAEPRNSSAGKKTKAARSVDKPVSMPKKAAKKRR